VVFLAQRRRYLLFGWLWYLVTLLPVIGFVKVGDHALADRYTYIPLIGLFVILVWVFGDVAERFRLDKRVVAASMLTVVAICTVLTNLYARKWHDSETLFRHALAVTNDNWVAHKNLAAVLGQQGKIEEALFNYTESLRIWPEPLAYVSQGWLRLTLGQYQQAIESCQQALAMAPNNDKAHFILGLANLALGNYLTVQTEYARLQALNSPYALRLLDETNRASKGPAPAP